MKRCLGLIFLVPLTGLACASVPAPYEPTSAYYAAQQIVIEDGKPQIERGRPNWFLDGINHYLFSLPAKLLLWDWQVLDHKLPEEHERILEHYLELNQLRSVKVRHNQYDPMGEWTRLRHNEEVGAGYRYTLGMLGWLRYTLFPDRLFAGLPIIGVGDHFNPFTNTVNVYSSDLAILLHEGGHAKDYTQHDSKGTTFALLRLVPVVDLVQEATASKDAVGYLHCIGDIEGEMHAYRVLIPAYSTYIANYLPGGPELTLPVVFAGHLTGRAQAARRWRNEIEEVELGGGVPQPEWCTPVPAPEDEGEDGQLTGAADAPPPPKPSSGSVPDPTPDGWIGAGSGSPSPPQSP